MVLAVASDCFFVLFIWCLLGALTSLGRAIGTTGSDAVYAYAAVAVWLASAAGALVLSRYVRRALDEPRLSSKAEGGTSGAKGLTTSSRMLTHGVSFLCLAANTWAWQPHAEPAAVAVLAVRCALILGNPAYFALMAWIGWRHSYRPAAFFWPAVVGASLLLTTPVTVALREGWGAFFSSFHVGPPIYLGFCGLAYCVCALSAKTRHARS